MRLIQQIQESQLQSGEQTDELLKHEYTFEELSLDLENSLEELVNLENMELETESMEPETESMEP